MTGSDHERWSDSVGAWVLGALPDDERLEFEAHLARCAVCRDEEAELRLAANALPNLVPQVAPAPELRDRIMAVVDAEAELLAAAGAGADRPRPARAPRRFWRWVPVPLAAAALATGAAVVVLGGDGTHAVRARVIAAAGSARLEIDGDSARLGTHLPAPPAGRVYQVWLQYPDGVRPTSALFSVDRAGRASVAVPGDLDDVEQVMVTDEPPSGSQRPTGNLLLSAVPA
jgi:anti-sigma-K factor RskA